MTAFDYGVGPNWKDQRPHPQCETTREQYPDPRPCAFGKDTCHLGHPANCRWLVDAELSARRTAGNAPTGGASTPDTQTGASGNAQTDGAS